jgi:hypothetical protein
MKRILVLLIAMITFVAGCKKHNVKPSPPPVEKPPICISLTPFLVGKYTPSEQSLDTLYIDFKRNLCPESMYNEYTVRKFDSIMNKMEPANHVPWGNYTLVSSKEEKTSVFASGQRLIVNLQVEDGVTKIYATYDNRVSKRFIKVQ